MVRDYSWFLWGWYCLAVITDLRFLPTAVHGLHSLERTSKSHFMYGHQQCWAIQTIPHLPGWLSWRSSKRASLSALGMTTFSSINTQPLPTWKLHQKLWKYGFSCFNLSSSDMIMQSLTSLHISSSRLLLGSCWNFCEPLFKWQNVRAVCQRGTGVWIGGWLAGRIWYFVRCQRYAKWCSGWSFGCRFPFHCWVWTHCWWLWNSVYWTIVRLVCRVRVCKKHFFIVYQLSFEFLVF